MRLLFDNFAAWSAQLAVLIAIGAVAALALAPGKARLVFWQGLLAVGLLLPVFEPWIAPATGAGDSISITTSPAIPTSAPMHRRLAFRPESLLWIVLAGA
ncbi:MAG TPA: hypothetical protein VKS01_06685, partial [Bryobacteraceae bacterium]|nr:hypothetical protein [Bryobacteraceae bacterium]